ncbi:MAG: RHS repeat-associated core domain-containing protein [Anaerolineales bacterium]|nr:RHS repeat-associated core domain-containing protein [Anaerolineales bacterium]
MTNNAGDITLVNTYEPYGITLSSAGDSATPYGFTGEITDSTGNIYLCARYYNPNNGRFLSRDTYQGDSQNPITFNKWQYTYSNPINLTDPSGKDPWWCNGDRECINAWLQAISTTSPATPPILDYVPESSQWNSQNPCGCNVWNFENWETLDGLSYSKWLEALQTYYQYCNTNRNEKNVFWEEESQLSLRLILAHNIIKEFGDMLLYDWGILDEQSEAYGRQYWEHCGPDGCFIKDGIADSRLISFLSGSQSWRDSAGGINDVIIGGFGPGKRQEALELADRIISPSGSDTAWKSGQLPNKPYHYGYISGSYPPSPKWLVEFLKKGSNQGYGSHQYVESYRDPYSNNLLFVLTPNQAEELCGDTICVQMNYNAPVPSWLNK